MAKARRNVSQRSELLYDLQEYGINPDTREIWLHGCTASEEEEGVDFRMAVMFEKNLSVISEADDGPILIHMHSIGGNWTDGAAIYDAIKACPCHVTILAYANARSMSSVILQAADTRVLTPHCHFLMHEGYYAFDGNMSSARAEMEQAVRDTDAMIQIYAERAVHSDYYMQKGYDEKKIVKDLYEMINKKEELYLTTRQAIRYGLCDAVLGDEGYENTKTLRG
jgi:ATP-dependent protease ClpP protease subunit